MKKPSTLVVSAGARGSFDSVRLRLTALKMTDSGAQGSNCSVVELEGRLGRDALLTWSLGQTRERLGVFDANRFEG